jgi:hypothetical protein
MAYTGRRVDFMTIVAIEGSRTLASLLKDVQDVIPIPGLSAVATIVLGILTLTEAASINKYSLSSSSPSFTHAILRKECLFLAARATHVIHALKDASQAFESSKVQEAAGKAVMFVLCPHSPPQYLKVFIMQYTQSCSRAIQAMVSAF